MLPVVGRVEEARAVAEEALSAARAHGNPFWVASALSGYARAFADTEPARAREAIREGLDCSRENRFGVGGDPVA